MVKATTTKDLNTKEGTKEEDTGEEEERVSKEETITSTNNLPQCWECKEE